jgi:hypothetical protein
VTSWQLRDVRDEATVGVLLQDDREGALHVSMQSHGRHEVLGVGSRSRQVGEFEHALVQDAFSWRAQSFDTMKGAPALSETGRAAADQAEDQTMAGRRVIFWLFLGLAAASALGLWMFSITPEGRTAKPIIVRALAGDLALPVVAWFILRGFNEPERKWTWFLLAPVAAAVAYLGGFLLFQPLFQ